MTLRARRSRPASAHDLALYGMMRELDRRRRRWQRMFPGAAISRARGGGDYARVLPRLTEHAEALRGEPFAVMQDITTVTGIRLAVAAQAARTGAPPRLVVVDYLTKLQPEGRHDRRDLAVGHMSWSLACLAVEYDITVLLLAQLNRASVEGGKMRRPSMAELRDSGAIEQDADQILLLWPGAAAIDAHSSDNTETTASVVQHHRTVLRQQVRQALAPDCPHGDPVPAVAAEVAPLRYSVGW